MSSVIDIPAPPLGGGGRRAYLGRLSTESPRMPDSAALPVNAIEVRGLEKTYAG